MNRKEQNLPLVIASIGAAVYLFAMLHSGSAPTHANRVESKIEGVLRFEPEQVTSISVTWSGQSFEFARLAGAWSHSNGDASNVRLGALNKALGLIHRAAPVRILRPEETASVAPSVYGLGPAELSVRVRAGAESAQVFHFGARANDGILQFARVDDAPEVYLFSGFVGEAWRAVVDLDFEPNINENAE